MHRILILVLFFAFPSVAEQDSEELRHAKAFIDKFESFDFSKGLDQRHATWMCIMYFNKYSKVSGAAGEAISGNEKWQCPIRTGFSGKKTGEFIHINKHSLTISAKSWPSITANKLTADKLNELKQFLEREAANKSSKKDAVNRASS